MRELEKKREGERERGRVREKTLLLSGRENDRLRSARPTVSIKVSKN